MVTQKRLKQLFTYNKKTGAFTFKVSRGGKHPGDRAGYRQTDGYIAISVDGIQYKAHRLAWLYVYGELPTDYLDHINLVKDDNRLCNLRKATRSQNHANRKEYKNNKLGIKGVYKAGNSYRALIRKDNVQIDLGCYRTKEAAAEAYNVAAKQLHGEYARP